MGELLWQYRLTTENFPGNELALPLGVHLVDGAGAARGSWAALLDF